jgi:hypothetical protein
MIAVRLISYKDMRANLAPYDCMRVATLQPGLELWETGWGTCFTLSPEANGSYDEWQYRRVLTEVIARTMPPKWSLKQA